VPEIDADPVQVPQRKRGAVKRPFFPLFAILPIGPADLFIGGEDMPAPVIGQQVKFEEMR